MRNILLILLILICSSLLFSEDIDVSLITIGPGDPLYVWWGHTALVFDDISTGQKYFVNFGLFRFDQDSFYYNFIMGRLNFMVGASFYRSEIEHYKAQDRWIIEQKLNLTEDEALRLYEMARTATEPENRVYRYDHLNDNCVTRPRNMLNEVLDNAIYDATAVPSGLSLREHMRRFTGDKHFLQWWLMYAQGGVIDAEASRWESMFLPYEFYKTLQTMPGLVEEELVIVPSEEPVRDEPENFLYYLLPFTAGIFLALIPFLSIIFPAHRILKTASVIEENILFFIIGVLGLFLIFLVFFTEHSVVKQNYNTILTPFFALTPFFVRKRHRRIIKTAVWSSLWTIACLMLILQPVIPHKNANIILTFLPVYTVFGGFPLLQKLLKRSQSRSMLQAG